MKYKKEIIILIITIIAVSGLVWGLIKFSKKAVNKEETSKSVEKNVEKDKKTKDSKNVSEKSKSDIDYMAKSEEMKKAPSKGEQIAIMTIKNYGEIKFKFFPDVAPKAVENFVTHSKQGYYNGLTFHRVIKDFMIQGGDPRGDGRGGESIWGEGFEKEVSEEYLPIKGTLCMASAQAPKSLGSQFFITQGSAEKDIIAKMPNVTQSQADAYLKYGGVPSLHGNYTVFGFAYEGQDIVDKIAAVSTDKMDKPENPVVIEKIEIKEAE